MIRTLAVLSLACVSMSACDIRFGDTGLSETDRVQIADVQATYDREFQAAVSSDGLGVQPGRFDQTLALISDADTASGPTVGAFFTLLEGLIYLQTGALGEAQLIAPEVATAARTLETDGVARRNVVLARTYSELVTGALAVDSLPSANAFDGGAQKQRIEAAKAITSSADDVTRKLCDAGPVDEGAAFVAAYQASFLVEADRALSLACVPRVTDPDACAGFLTGREELQTARALLASFAKNTDARSQIARIQTQIDRDLSQSNDGAPLPAPTSPCP